jgi:hypothetical protein
VRVFKNAWFSRFARKGRISDRSLLDAIALIGQGRIDADLGGGVIKQRIARAGQGKSGGFRTILVFRAGDRAIFVYGFAKSQKANIDKDEEQVFKRAARHLLALTPDQLTELVGSGTLVEIDEA